MATVDTTGKIVAKSTPIPFIKQAAAASLNINAFDTTENKPRLISSGLVGTILLVLGGVFVIALIVVGVLHSRHNHEDDEGGGGSLPPVPPADNA